MTKNPYSFGDLIQIMQRLRDPQTGCPWDVEQTFETIAPYTIEEAYEVEDAIQSGDMDALKSELGDLLFQSIFHARIAEEAGHFNVQDVIHSICDKMVRRHPHVFGDATIEDADAQTKAWEVQKENERQAAAAARGETPSILDGVAKGLPSLLRAYKLQNRAARVGFDWPETNSVLDKVREETEELAVELTALKTDPSAKERINEEMGDLLFVYANLARHLDVNPEDALRAANTKFERRFHQIEAFLAEQGKTPEQSDLAEMDALWDRAKTDEKS